MISPVQYTDVLMAKVREFENLKPEEKNASYWDKTDDGELSDLKEAIKNHYIIVQDYTCPYCHQRIEVNHKAAWDAEHIIAKATHPQFMFAPENICVACKDCNHAKSDKNVLKNKSRKTFPVDSDDYLMVHPHFDNYEQNINIIEAACFYLPKSDKGRATVEICGLLRFLYKFSDYECVSEEITSRLSKLTGELMRCEDGAGQVFLLSCIESLASEGIAIQTKKKLDNMMVEK
jgi:hypothetical protein